MKLDTRQVSVLVAAPPSLESEVLVYALSCRDQLRVLTSVSEVCDLVEKVRVSRPDVALLCLDRGGWDGLAGCATVKQLGLPTRVVAIGAPGDNVTLMAAVRAGADGFVTTEDSLDEVVAVLERVAGGESSVPGEMLGALLRGLISFRREDDAIMQRFASLGNREREVLAELVAGLDHQAIAAKLHLSPHTARTHTQNIFAKLGVHSRLEAAQLVLEHDLLERFGLERFGADSAGGAGG